MNKRSKVGIGILVCSIWSCNLFSALWINELHYDNAGTDSDEGVEIAGTAGTDLTGYTLVAYNGNNGMVYDTVTLTGSINDQGSGYGAVWFDIPGLQNGAPDGIAFVDDADTVIQFLSYEGTFSAVDGPAAGMTSQEIGVSETTTTAVGDALQLTGTGSFYAAFTWNGPVPHSRGLINSNQNIIAGGIENPGAFTAIAAGANRIELSWTKNGVGDDVMLARSAGDSFSRPVDGTQYSINDTLGTATVIYTGSGTGTNDSGLEPNATWYYKAWSVQRGGTSDPAYSAGTAVKAATTGHLPPPVAYEPGAGAVSDSSFRAEWSPVNGAESYRLDVLTAAEATDIFISEYCEGSSYNKYLELFNGTGTPVDISLYDIVIYINGSTSAASPIALSGTLAEGGVYSIAHSSAAAWPGTPDVLSGSLTFNGNDAIALRKNTVEIDVLGTIGSDADWGSDITLRRKAAVASPAPVYDTNQWNAYAVDTVDGLGAHTFDGTGYVPGYEDAAIHATNEVVSGLNPFTLYYYRVRACSATSTSPDSNTIAVETIPEPAVFGLLLAAGLLFRRRRG